MKRKKFIFLLLIILSITLLGCKPYIESCTIGNETLSIETFRERHPDTSEDVLQKAWDASQDAFLIGYYKNGICDKVILR